MLAGRTDLRLVAQQFLGEADLADSCQLDRPLDVGQMVDRRIAQHEGVGGKPGIHAEALTGEQAVEAFRRFGGGRRGPQQRRDRCRAAARLFRPGCPIICAGAELTLLGGAGDITEGARRRLAIAHPPRGQARGPGGLRCPIADRTLAPGVGHAPRVEIESQHIINEGDARSGFGTCFDRERWRILQQQRFGSGGIVGLDQRIERRPQLIGIGLA